MSIDDGRPGVSGTTLLSWDEEWAPGGIFDMMPDAIVAMSRDGRIANANSRLAVMFGYAGGELVGSPIEILLPERLRAGHVQQRDAFQDSPHVRSMSRRQDLFGLRKDGSEFPVDIMLSPVSSLGGEQVIAVIRDVSAAHAAAEQLNQLAYADQLTGLPNRSALYRDLATHLAAERPAGSDAVSVALFDLDRFKDVNDTMGHSVGDDLLRQVAARWISVLPRPARLYRLGGDEFVLLIPRSGDLLRIVAVIHTMIDQLAAPFEIRGKPIIIGTSVGIAAGSKSGGNVEEVMGAADLALYRAKGQGRGKYAFYVPVMRADAQARRELVTEIEQAYAAGELELYLQPQVSLPDLRFTGAEALLRWRHRGMGILPPSTFIETLAASPIVSEVGRWVVRTACLHASRWRREGLPELTIAVNLFEAQIRDSGLLQEIKDVLAEFDLPPEILELEISENFALDGDEAIIGSLSALRRWGVKLALDDLGTGHASLNYLTKLPISSVKIDQSFVQRMTTDRKDAVVVQALISMAHGLGLGVVAEGVETALQAEILTATKCDQAQGYLFGRPLPADDFRALIAGNAGQLRLAAG